MTSHCLPSDIAAFLFFLSLLVIMDDLSATFAKYRSSLYRFRPRLQLRCLLPVPCRPVQVPGMFTCIPFRLNDDIPESGRLTSLNPLKK
ncbi:uncharacterized protein BO95DRAFT_424180 [Aspergillus brunneoviolaceus CBS 621.78]|uniref:Uncharacterized protein n=1 Tax=Aspergillus brunneoviolaceus CBS 621.78 TaxID=1450534 RepID=A0ACD1FUL8_9EURO|nr:hypothetical protein BO95DRAFT_424180 [Aspergillus brunneoviolaceus CBS 621.78]RAH40708.1 hypothetical protein BO95DRAFT_424180 [Aspergillus brunneoviolaceus CBS 621.78]